MVFRSPFAPPSLHRAGGMEDKRSTRSRDSVVSNPSVTSTVSESAATTQQFSALNAGGGASNAAPANFSNAAPNNDAQSVLVSSANAVDASVYDRLLKDYKRLRSKVEVLEKENEDLRASLWEVSWRSKPHKDRLLAGAAGVDEVVNAPIASAAVDSDYLKLNEAPPSSSIASSLLRSDASAPSATSSTRDVALNREHAISLPSTRENGEPSTREYRWKKASDLNDHRGAVYALQWTAEYLATAGMDGVRVWKCQDWQEDVPYLSLHLTHHTAPVSSLACATDAIITGGFDSTVMLNDLVKGEPTWHRTTEGLVQAVAWTRPTHSDFAWGTTGKYIGLADRRAKHVLGEYQAEAMINTMYVLLLSRSPPKLTTAPTSASLSTEQLLCGLSSGQTRLFDLRTMSFVPVQPLTTSTKRSPLSCLVTTLKDDRLCATTSFDNSVRVYDRSTIGPDHDHQPKLIHTLKTKNRHYPIKCAWYKGSMFTDLANAKRRRTAPAANRSISNSLLLATGSSDPTVLVYDLSNVATTAEQQNNKDNGKHSDGSIRSRDETGTGSNAAGTSVEKEEVKCARLEGHKEAVYAVDFSTHADLPLLASGAGDGVVKVWRVVESD